MKMRTLLIWLAVAFQVGVVAAMALSREWILASGESYLFQSAPIDPRDIFRGDYVRLDYLFSRVPVSQLDEAVIENGLAKGQKVYLAVNRDENGVTRAGRLYASPPQGQAYLAGYSKEHWPYRSYLFGKKRKLARRELLPVRVKYGIEQYYVEQGKGREMEDRRGSRDGWQVPLLIHARVSSSGEAVIRSYEWANIAVKTEVLRSPEREAPEGHDSAVIGFAVMNRGERSLRLPLKPGNCSFSLIPAQQAPLAAADFADQRSDCITAEVEPVVLAPGESYSVSFDLNQPHWSVMQKETPTPPGRLPWNYRYRVQYEGEAIPGVQAMLVSRAFHGSGSID